MWRHSRFRNVWKNMEAVRECVVLGVKDPDGLAKTKAFVVLNQGFSPSENLAEDLKNHCRQKMAPFKAPRFIQFLNELPKTGQGKIDKRQLMEKNRHENWTTRALFLRKEVNH